MEKGDHLEVNLFSGDDSTSGQDFTLTCNGVSTHTNFLSGRDGALFFEGTCEDHANGDYSAVASF
jgi:hypothetical protein